MSFLLAMTFAGENGGELSTRMTCRMTPAFIHFLSLRDRWIGSDTWNHLSNKSRPVRVAG